MENKTSLVSIIVPCYNHGIFIREALQSIQKQTYNEWECIIVDNGSTDNTRKIAEKYSRSDKRFRYIYLQQQGVSKARNIGINNSLGKFILPLDADDKIGSDYLIKAVKVLEKNDSVKIVYCNAELFGALNHKWELPEFTMQNMILENCIFCTAFFRRVDYDKTRGYNEQMIMGFEDWDFWLELLKTGGEVYKIDKTLFHYRIRSESRNSQLDAEKQKFLRKQIYRNHKELIEKYLEIPDVLFEYYTAKESLSKIETSKEYRLGNKIFSVLRKLSSLIKI
jgi:glycosyltransferase involved in cell wall biosynthesis